MLFYQVLLSFSMLIASSGASSLTHVGMAYAESEQEKMLVSSTYDTPFWINALNSRSVRIQQECITKWYRAVPKLSFEEAKTVSVAIVLSSDKLTFAADKYHTELLKEQARRASQRTAAKIDVEMLEKMRTRRSSNFTTLEWERFDFMVSKMPTNYSLFEILGLEASEVLANFKISPLLGVDGLRILDYEFVCNENYAPVTLKVSSKFSQDRVVGTLTKVPPKGVMVNRGSLFRYFQVPNRAIVTDSGIVSVKDCNAIGTIFSCSIVTDDCTLESYESCEQSFGEMTDGAFVLKTDETTFVATRLKKFTIWNTTHSIIQDVADSSGQFFIELPLGWHARIGKTTIIGRHEKLLIVPVLVDELLDMKSNVNQENPPTHAPPVRGPESQHHSTLHDDRLQEPKFQQSEDEQRIQAMAFLGTIGFMDAIWLLLAIPKAFVIAVTCIVIAFAAVGVIYIGKKLLECMCCFMTCCDAMMPERRRRDDRKRKHRNRSPSPAGSEFTVINA